MNLGFERGGGNIEARHGLVIGPTVRLERPELRVRGAAGRFISEGPPAKINRSALNPNLGSFIGLIGGGWRLENEGEGGARVVAGARGSLKGKPRFVLALNSD